MAIGKVGGDLHPFPAFGSDSINFTLKLLGDEPIEQHRILQPTAIVLLEQIPHDGAAGGLIVLDADELRTLVGGANRPLGEQPTNVVRFLGVGALQGLPHLLLALVVGIDRECHELVERHAILGIDVEQLRRDGGKLEPLLHHLDADEERGRDLLLAHALLAQCKKGAKLVERMKRRALHVLGERILLGEPFGAHDARDRRGASKPLLLHEEFERAITPPAGRNLEHAGFGAIVVENRPDGEALQERATGDVLGKLLNGDARLDTPHVRLAQHQAVEGNVTRLAEGDFLLWL